MNHLSSSTEHNAMKHLLNPGPGLIARELISCLMYDVTPTQGPLIISALNDPAWTNKSPGVGSNTADLLAIIPALSPLLEGPDGHYLVSVNIMVCGV